MLLTMWDHYAYQRVRGVFDISSRSPALVKLSIVVVLCVLVAKSVHAYAFQLYDGRGEGGGVTCVMAKTFHVYFGSI